jgi:hypothetical protein
MKKVSTPPLVKHKDHQIKILPSAGTKHAAMYHCIDCNKWVAWLSKADSEQARQLGLLE